MAKEKEAHYSIGNMPRCQGNMLTLLLRLASGYAMKHLY